MMSVFSKKESGYVVVAALVFGGLFVGITYSLAGFLFSQHQAQRQARQSAESFQIAEAGLDWYRWYLAHNPSDFDGPDDEMPFEKEITDPETGSIGTAQITATGSQLCGQTSTVDITSTGWSDDNPDVTRSVRGRYTRPSVGQYSYIINADVWAGDDRQISGPYHSNGGIRMDGSNDSLVTSAKEEWQCSGGFGCDESGETRPGVFGDGINDDLWKYPVPQIDFTGITLDLNEIRSVSKSDGIYFGAAGSESDRNGWHMVFNGNGSANVYRVRNTDYTNEVTGYQCYFFGCYPVTERNYNVITDEDYIGNFEIPDSCPVVYFEDKLWIDGEVSGKVAVAAAKQQANRNVDVILNDSITYANGSDSDGLTLISEGSVLIPLLSPDQMTLNGIFIAQNGRFGRNNYTNDSVDYNRRPFVRRDQLIINGTIVSNDSVGTKWVSGDGDWISGYDNRINAFDQDLALDPPPLTPNVSEQFEFIRWQEINQ